VWIVSETGTAISTDLETGTIIATGSGQIERHELGYRLAWTYLIDDTWRIRVGIANTTTVSCCAVSQILRGGGSPRLIYLDADTEQVRSLPANDPDLGSRGLSTTAIHALETTAMQLAEQAATILQARRSQ
jgi:hypothetical protein